MKLNSLCCDLSILPVHTVYVINTLAVNALLHWQERFHLVWIRSLALLGYVQTAESTNEKICCGFHSRSLRHFHGFLAQVLASLDVDFGAD